MFTSRIASILALVGLCFVCRIHAVSGPVSVVFIIDHSSSMNQTDSNDMRFHRVSSLLDTLSVLTPESEAALVIFTRRLQFDHRDSGIFITAFPGDTSQHDAYVPLTQLGKVFPNGRSGKDTLQALIQTSDSGNLVLATKYPGSRSNANILPNNLRDGSDITLGFEAAKRAMALSINPKENQVFVFLSGGVPILVDSGRVSTMNDYVQGVGVPKTVALFFNGSSSQALPAPLLSMIDNIKANGYSIANPSSAFYLADDSNDFMDAVLNALGNPVTSLAVRMPKPRKYSGKGFMNVRNMNALGRKPNGP